MMSRVMRSNAERAKRLAKSFFSLAGKPIAIAAECLVSNGAAWIMNAEKNRIRDLLSKYSPSLSAIEFDDILLRARVITQEKLLDFQKEEISKAFPLYTFTFVERRFR